MILEAKNKFWNRKNRVKLLIGKRRRNVLILVIFLAIALISLSLLAYQKSFDAITGFFAFNNLGNKSSSKFFNSDPSDDPLQEDPSNTLLDNPGANHGSGMNISVVNAFNSFGGSESRNDSAERESSGSSSSNGGGSSGSRGSSSGGSRGSSSGGSTGSGSAGGGGSNSSGGGGNSSGGENNSGGEGNNGNSGGEETDGGNGDSKGLIITLVSPVENGGSGRGVVFSYNISGQESASKCSLILDEKIAAEDSSISRGINTFALSNLDKGKHFWKVLCESDSLAAYSSSKRRITAFHLSGRFEFLGDLNNLDMERVENFSLNRRSFGLIKFLEAVNLSNAEDIEENIMIDKNFISLNSEKLPELNKPAVITFYGLDFENPIILRDGKSCSDCKILGNSDELVFKVNHFSNYSISENSALLVWDSTVGGSIVFYANYTNRTDNAAIAGATCNVDYGDGDHLMSYSGGLYFYDSSFSGSGTATINCSAADYTEIVLTDYFSAHTYSRVSGAQVDAGDSQTAPADSPQSHTALAGNVTYLDLVGLTTTQAWQGYYGNVSGTIQLADSSSKVLYNWSETSPNGEVYSTRAFDANFAEVSCAGSGEIASEESFMGQDPSDVDSISNTFDQNSHPPFFVGSIQILQDNCSSVNLYGSGGEQSSLFYEVLLKDGDSNIVYTSILEQDEQGFDGENYDFEMMVSEDGHGNNTAATVYYFYLEFG
jgi:hypothetical protein